MPVKANIFSSRPYAFLAEKIAAAPSEIDFRLGKIEHTRFPDGENYYRLLEAREIRNSPAVYVAGTVSDAAVMEMYNICSALVMEQCSSLHIVIPYFDHGAGFPARRSRHSQKYCPSAEFFADFCPRKFRVYG